MKLIINKKAQIMGMPFQLIFSLILIAVFIFAAIQGIKYFIRTSELAKINSFIVDLRSKVENAYLATEISQTYEFSLPAKIKFVCFASGNLTKNTLYSLNITECNELENYLLTFKNMNMFFCPPGAASNVGVPIYAMIDCNGNNCLAFGPEPYCINNSGKIKITLEKNYGEKTVKLK